MAGAEGTKTGDWGVRSPGRQAPPERWGGEAAGDGGVSLEGERSGREWAPRFQNQRGGRGGGAQDGGTRGQGWELERCGWGAGDEACSRAVRAEAQDDKDAPFCASPGQDRGHQPGVPRGARGWARGDSGGRAARGPEQKRQRLWASACRFCASHPPARASSPSQMPANPDASLDRGGGRVAV